MMTRHKTRPSYQRGIDAALALLKAIGRKDGPSRVSDVALALHIPHASVYRIIRTLAEHSLVVSTGRGWIAPGPTWATLARRYEDAVRGEDERSRMRESFRSSVRGAACSFPGDPHPYLLASDHNFRRSPKYRIGFANAALDSPWRTALVHAVEFGAARRRDLVGSLVVRHAARSVARQVTDLESLIEAGVDGLVVSALDVDAISPIMGRAAERGIPTVLVDRGRAGTGPHVSYVACDNWMIGWTMAQWLCEHIAGRGGIVMLSGDRSAEPAQRRSEGARSAFAQFREIRVLAQEWTDWQKARGFDAMRAASAEHGHDIAGVWCDSGLQASGSLRACIEAGRRPIPPHTGGDLNSTYKLAVRHGVALAAVNYPPAMGLRAVEILLDVLRGRSVPRQVNVPTEVVVTRNDATRSVRPDLWVDEHVRWDLPDELILAAGLGPAYNPRAFRVYYGGNRYNRSAATTPEASHAA